MQEANDKAMIKVRLNEEDQLAEIEEMWIKSEGWTQSGCLCCYYKQGRRAFDLDSTKAGIRLREDLKVKMIKL